MHVTCTGTSGGQFGMAWHWFQFRWAISVCNHRPVTCAASRNSTVTAPPEVVTSEGDSDDLGFVILTILCVSLLLCAFGGPVPDVKYKRGVSFLEGALGVSFLFEAV